MDIGGHELGGFLGEKKDQQLLLEHLKGLLDEKKQAVVAGFRERHKAFAKWADENKYPLLTIQKNLVQMVLAGSVSLSAIAGVTLPGTNQAQAPPQQSDASTTTTNADPYTTIQELLK